MEESWKIITILALSNFIFVPWERNVIKDEENYNSRRRLYISTRTKGTTTKHGYSVIILDDFKNPLETILKQNGDMILLDINLPKINGEFLLKEIRKKTNIPIIMVTSRNTETDEIIRMTAGADDFIIKPYNPNILLLIL